MKTRLCIDPESLVCLKVDDGLIYRITVAHVGWERIELSCMPLPLGPLTTGSERRSVGQTMEVLPGRDLARGVWDLEA